MPGRGTKAVSSSLTGNYTSLSEGLMALINRLMSLRTASIDCIDRTPLDAVQQTECADSEEETRRLISKKNGALISQGTVVLRAPLFKRS